MRLKKYNMVLFVLVCSFLLCGCGNNKDTATGSISNPIKETIVEESFDENGSGTLKCVTATADADNMEVNLGYIVKYKRGNILELRSVSKISSADKDILDDYYDAYKNISNSYNGLKYYDVSLTKDDNTVIYDVVINYEKIDTDALLKIEGKEDNIIVRGKAKLSLWLDLAEKFGTTCEEA